MKIELDLPQVPDGWRCIGYQVPKEGQGYISTDNTFYIAIGDKICHRLTFERIEPEDTELEQA